MLFKGKAGGASLLLGVGAASATPTANISKNSLFIITSL